MDLLYYSFTTDNALPIADFFLEGGGRERERLLLVSLACILLLSSTFEVLLSRFPSLIVTTFFCAVSYCRKI
jgi:hypothetical protein